MSALNEYEFQIQIDADEMLDEHVGLVIEAGCDDGFVCQDDNMVYIEFCRRGRSLDQIVRATVQELEDVGLPLIVNDRFHLPLASN